LRNACGTSVYSKQYTFTVLLSLPPPFMEYTQPAARPDLYAEPRSVNVYGVVWPKASHTLQPLLTYCTSPSEF
jgi:hypothetical protein